jgi:hypothetical protein
MIWTRIGQFVLVLMPILLFSWLLAQELVPSGQFFVESAAGDNSPFIDQLLPDQRVESIVDEDRGKLQRITGDPSFFFVHPHREFDSVQTEIWFYNETQPIVEFGGLASLETGAYDLYPLHNLILDSLGWNMLEQGELVLYEREAGFQSVDQFQATTINRERIATYHADLTSAYRMVAYEPSEESRLLSVSLRGFHSMKTYIKNEPLSFQLSYMDMNRAEGSDPVRILVYNEDDEIVEDVRVDDDGNSTSDAAATALKTAKVFVEGLPEGVYKMEWVVSRDIFVRSIETPQQYLVFSSNIYVADEVGYHEAAEGATVWSNAHNYAFQTRHGEGVQEVVVAGEKLFVEEPYLRYTLATEQAGVKEITLPYGDLEIQTDGYVALDPSMYFHPDPVRLTDQTDIDALQIDYILTTYKSPVQEGEWLVAHVEFAAQTLVLNEGSWKFVFSVPNMSERQSFVDVGKIKMIWQREPFTFQDGLEYFYGLVE